MKQAVFIIQGEGKGHFSQALAMLEQLNRKGIQVAAVYLGRHITRSSPGYFSDSFPLPVHSFYSPNLLFRSDRRGIRAGTSILFHALLSPLYLAEAFRIWRSIRQLNAYSLYNFYDTVGAVVCRLAKRRQETIVVGHHFYFAQRDFTFPPGFPFQRRMLGFLNRFMLRGCHRALALSFRPSPDQGRIEVIPPLVHPVIRNMTWSPGNRDLCYFLTPGYARDYLSYARETGAEADIFVSGGVDSVQPDGVAVYEPTVQGFREKMKHCKRLVTTGGFDTVAEAFYLGIPVYMIPARGHYEQRCNAADAERTGMAVWIERLRDLDKAAEPGGDHVSYRRWVDKEDS